MKKEDVTIDDAIKFVDKQIKINLNNKKKIKKMNFDTSILDDWNIIYLYIKEKLESLKDE